MLAIKTLYVYIVVKSAGQPAEETTMSEVKTLYRIEWLDAPDKDGNRVIQSTTARKENMIIAITEVCNFFGIALTDVIKIEQVFN